jgi:hypothetical protein
MQAYRYICAPSFSEDSKAEGNRNITAISENCDQPELNKLVNGEAQIEETATQLTGRLRC